MVVKKMVRRWVGKSMERYESGRSPEGMIQTAAAPGKMVSGAWSKGEDSGLVGLPQEKPPPKGCR